MNLEGALVADLVDDATVVVVEDGELLKIGGEEGGSRGGGAERGDWEKRAAVGVISGNRRLSWCCWYMTICNAAQLLN
ncbi:unnamed protein product [Linum trigynum]|uniref:Uncharacterized protein n=1 Tax=Linum trigynum TaxID=586398 RepID=A0AAV2F8Y5_9ROSI